MYLSYLNKLFISQCFVCKFLLFIMSVLLWTRGLYRTLPLCILYCTVLYTVSTLNLADQKLNRAGIFCEFMGDKDVN